MAARSRSGRVTGSPKFAGWAIQDDLGTLLDTRAHQHARAFSTRVLNTFLDIFLNRTPSAVLSDSTNIDFGANKVL